MRHLVASTGCLLVSLTSRGELLRQWYDMLKQPGETFTHWHMLSPETPPVISSVEYVVPIGHFGFSLRSLWLLTALDG